MRSRFSIHDNFSLLVAFAIVIGLLSSYYELSQLLLSRVVQPDFLDYLIAISHVLFFSLLAGILIYSNTRPLPVAENRRHFVQAILVVAFFCLIAWLGFDGIIKRSNKRHELAYAAHFDKKIGNVWENWEQEKRSYYFHDSATDWMEKAILLFVNIFVISRIYNMSRRREELELHLKKLENVSLQSQISALHNQINPHLFFNALNALYALISEENTQNSLQYVSNLSTVFRYILQSGKKDLVSLQEEFDFLDTYRAMLNVKYGERLAFEIQIDEHDLRRKLPVLSLLPLIENVTKHNVVSKAHPMVIWITVENLHLVIANKKKPPIDEVSSDGTGLDNLKNRFYLLTGNTIEVEETPNDFIVRLPLSPFQHST